MAIHASLNMPRGDAHGASSAIEVRARAEIADLAARHGIHLNASPETMRWLVKTHLPVLDERGFAAISALVQHLYGLSTPGGYPRSSG